MSTKMPPVPADNQNPKGPPEPRQSKVEGGLPDPGKATDPDKQGQQGNSRINTTHQGYQQDR